MVMFPPAVFHGFVTAPITSWKFTSSGVVTALLAILSKKRRGRSVQGRKDGGEGK
jgi:hypothetical protein